MLDLDRLIAGLPPSPSLPPGWAGWVAHEALAIPTARVEKLRPWCRGRERALRVEWFPRTSKVPWEGTRFAVPSPAGHLPGLGQAGWFVANAYVLVEATFDPAGEPLGQLSDAFLDRLYRCLDNVYWDSHRREG